MSDDDGSCAVSGKLARLNNGSCAVSGELVTHATRTFGDNGHRQNDLKLKGKERTKEIGVAEKRGNR